MRTQPLLRPPRLRRRWLHQLLAYGTPLREARRRLLALLERPVDGDVGGLLVHAWERIPFWRERMRAAGLGRADLRRPEALAAIPPLRRAEVQGRLHDLLDWTGPAGARDDDYRGQTSGSTGEPLRYVADGFTYLWFWAFLDLALAYHGLGAPRPLSQGVVLLCALEHAPPYGDLAPLFHGTFFAKRNVGEPGLARWLERRAPAVVTGDPDSLRFLLETRARPRIVLSSAFAMPGPLRRDLEAHLGCPVVEYYSAAETSVIGVACREGRGYHVLTPAAHVEAEPEPEPGVASHPIQHWGSVLTETEHESDAGHGARHEGTSGHRGAHESDPGCGPGPERDPIGRAEPGRDPLCQILVTNLRNRRFPLIRYEVGDLGRLDRAPCPCGLRAPRIVGLAGRTATLFRAAGPEGARFDPAGLNPLLARLPLVELRLVERAPGRYRLEHRAARDLDPHEREAVRARLAWLSGFAAPEVDFARTAAPLRRAGEKPRPFVPLPFARSAVAEPGPSTSPGPAGRVPLRTNGGEAASAP